jgi:pimeloyl-ACP methyl ester carboxylesterase
MPIKPIRDEYIIAGETTLHYMQWGEEGPPVICIHASTTNAFCFQALADELAADHQVIAYDLRGRGDSDKPEEGYSISFHAEDLAELIYELGLERPILIGHALGALIALYFAVHYPAKLHKLVLIDASAPPPGHAPEEQPAWLTGHLGTPFPSYQEYTAHLKALPFLGPYWNAYFDLYFRQDVYSGYDGTITAKTYRQGIIEEGQHIHEIIPEKLWPQVNVPTLLLRAGQGLFSDNDQLFTEEAAQSARQAIPACYYVNFPGLNHYTILFGTQHGPAQAIRKFICARKEGM